MSNSIGLHKRKSKTYLSRRILRFLWEGDYYEVLHRAKRWQVGGFLHDLLRKEEI